MNKPVALTPFVCELLSIGQLFKDGFIDESECDRRMEEVLARAYAAIDGKVKP